ncbi:MAG: nucleoside phosphorylase [Pseudomonadota bacterium]
MKKHIKQSAINLASKEGRQYHIGLKPGEVAPYILFCGDPTRARMVAKYFDQAGPEITHREYVTITGKYKELPLTVMATGMGADNIEIAVVELFQIVNNPTIIRIGSSGALKKEIALADLIISTGAVRLESVSLAYVVEGYPCLANYEVILALLMAAKQNKFPHHAGITATCSSFYAPQSRNIPPFQPRDKDLPTKLEAMNVFNLEMETSCLFTLASMAGFRAGTVCAAYANRYHNKFVEGELKDEAEKRCVETGLKAFEIIAKMDAQKKGDKYWLPTL